MTNILPKKLSLLPFLMLLFCAAIGQNTSPVKGLIFNKNTKAPVSRVTIRNVNTGKMQSGGGDGRFQTAAGRGQILAFTANGFFSDTLRLTDSLMAVPELRVALKPLPVTLENVTVVAGRNAYQNDSIARRNEFLALVGQHEIPALSRANDLGFGIGINLDRYGKTEKRKRQARGLFDIMEDDAYVNYRWNEQLVEKYTSFQGDRLNGFMEQYRPAYDWLRKHPAEEDLLYYINDKLKRKGH